MVKFLEVFIDKIIKILYNIYVNERKILILNLLYINLVRRLQGSLRPPSRRGNKFWQKLI